MELFTNLIYEYKKGMRDMAMYTCKKEDYHTYAQHLMNNEVEFVTREIGNEKVNFFFGNADCLSIFEGFSSDKLNELTKYEDFILGIMLGYSRCEQYQRFLNTVNAPSKMACPT